MYKLLIFTTLIGLSLAAIHGNFNNQRRSSSFGSQPHHQQQQQQQYHHSAASSGPDAHAETRAFHSDVRHDGFDYALETTNGIHATQSGDEHGNVHGDYEYVSPEGVHVRVAYVADENGYQPQSDLLPTPPPIPPQILKALEYIRTHPAHEEHYGSAAAGHQHAPAAHHAPARSQHRFSSPSFGRHH